MPATRRIRVAYSPIKDTYRVRIVTNDNDIILRVSRWEVYNDKTKELVAVGTYAQKMYDALQYHNVEAVFSYLQTLLYIMNL
jgi:ABC-type amino acid transport substrate-binding protein